MLRSNFCTCSHNYRALQNILARFFSLASQDITHKIPENKTRRGTEIFLNYKLKPLSDHFSILFHLFLQSGSYANGLSIVQDDAIP